MKTRIFILLLSFLSLFSANSHAISQQEKSKSESTITGQQKNIPAEDQVATLNGILNSFVKVNENDHPVFQNFQQNKRSLANRLSWNSSIAQNAFYVSYSRIHRNSIHSSPFYIAYRRLTI
jgi:hypothetical protein